MKKLYEENYDNRFDGAIAVISTPLLSYVLEQNSIGRFINLKLQDSSFKFSDSENELVIHFRSRHINEVSSRINQ